jgi:TPR repeat protein
MKYILLFILILPVVNSQVRAEAACSNIFINYDLPYLKEIDNDYKTQFCSLVQNKTCQKSNDLMEYYNIEAYSYAKGICGKEQNYQKALDNFLKSITDVNNLSFSFERDTSLDSLFSEVMDKVIDSNGYCAQYNNQLLNQMYDKLEDTYLYIQDTNKLREGFMFDKFYMLLLEYEGNWNYGRAFRWIEKSATRGWNEAINKAALGYYQGKYPYLLDSAIKTQNKKCGSKKHGHFLLKDSVEAYKWYNIGAYLGDQNAAYDRDLMEKNNKISSQGIIEANKLAKDWIRNELKN